MTRIVRVARKVINMQTGRPLPCSWNDCEKDGTTLYEAREYEGTPEGGTATVKYVFCSERHKMLWVNSSRNLGNLPPGYRWSLS